MADRLVSEIDWLELSKAVLTALRDAGIDYAEVETNDEGNSVVTLDGNVPVIDLGHHLQRILLLDPPPPAT